MKTDKILILADDSESSAGAIQYGFNLAKQLGAKVALLSVIAVAMTEGNVDAGIFPDDAREQAKKQTWDFLEKLQKSYGKYIETELMAPTGDIKTIVANTAKEWGAKLIVTGTHGRAGLSKLLMGSIAESIIHSSEVPVCVVPMAK